MKLKIIIPILLFLSVSGYSQDKRDYYWILGIDQEAGPGIRALEFDFNQRPFEPGLRDKGLNFDRNNVSISDREGRLLFYSNGCAVANRNHEVMVNGDSINAGEFLDDFWSDGSCDFGYPGRQNMLILEDPATGDGYYMIHKRFDERADGSYRPLSLSYTYVDMALEDGLGAVVEKNIDFHTIDEFLSSYLSAIYQSNGRDWWLINPGADGQFYTYSLQEDGLNLHLIQDALHAIDPTFASASGDAKFSPDGRMYAYFNLYDGLLLYDFDRASGSLSNLRRLGFPYPKEVSFSTCEWSPNSEFLYLASSDTLWQIEVAYDNLEEGKVFIAAHNGVNDPFSTRFFLSTLGPDCRIYIRPGSSSRSFHVIHKPDEKGIACELEQQGIQLPEISSTGGFPNFPRFRVNEEEKCDPTLLNVLGEDVFWRRDLKMYPNPASDFITVEISDDSPGELFVLDMAGRLVYHEKDFGRKKKVDVSFLEAGVYSVEYVPGGQGERIIYTQRMVKVE